MFTNGKPLKPIPSLDKGNRFQKTYGHWAQGRQFQYFRSLEQFCFWLLNNSRIRRNDMQVQQSIVEWKCNEHSEVQLDSLCPQYQKGYRVRKSQNSSEISAGIWAKYWPIKFWLRQPPPYYRQQKAILQFMLNFQTAVLCYPWKTATKYQTQKNRFHNFKILLKLEIV